MKYGEIQYREVRELEVPNVILDRSDKGDWIDRFDEPQTTATNVYVVLQGYPEIYKYAASAMERWKVNHDIQAGLVAVQIYRHYREQLGDTADEERDGLIQGLMADKHPDSSKFLTAIGAHPDIAAKLQEIMRQRALQHTSVRNASSDPHLMAYLEAVADTNDFDDTIKKLQQLRG